jgi:hypothetical protein
VLFIGHMCVVYWSHVCYLLVMCMLFAGHMCVAIQNTLNILYDANIKSARIDEF